MNAALAVAGWRRFGNIHLKKGAKRGNWKATGVAENPPYCKGMPDPANIGKGPERTQKTFACKGVRVRVPPPAY
jgi:hypothetical protein